MKDRDLSDIDSKSALLKSPRTIEACKRQGYNPKELLFKTKQDLKIDIGDLYIDNDILQVRWKAHEEKRKRKIKNVMLERKKVIEESSSKLNFFTNIWSLSLSLTKIFRRRFYRSVIENANQSKCKY